MFDIELFEEAKYLFNKYGKNNVLMNTIGVKELFDVIYNNIGIDIAKEEIKKNTRHYIKRQISWFKNDKDMNWLYIDEPYNHLLNLVFTLVEKFL